MVEVEPSLHGQDKASDGIAGLRQVVAALICRADGLAVGGTSRPWPLSSTALVELAYRSLPAALHVDLLVADAGTLVPVAVSERYPEQLAEIRMETGEGPCFEAADAADAAAPVISDELYDDARWPRFGARVVAATGILSAISYHVCLPGRRHGALSVYSDWPYGFDDLAITTGALLATTGSLAALS